MHCCCCLLVSKVNDLYFLLLARQQVRIVHCLPVSKSRKPRFSFSAALFSRQAITNVNAIKEETTGWPEGAPQSEWPGQNQWPEGQLGSKPELQTAQEFAQGMQDVQAGQVDSAHYG